MTNWWFTSDTHFDHPWCAGWRGYSYVTEMDNDLIVAWNRHVSPADVVVVLGDFYWGSHLGYLGNLLRRLNGTKIWVKGNHDRWIQKAGVNFRRIMHRKINDHYFAMCHYPMWTWNRKDYGARHLHGHSHGKTLPRINMLDVGVDNAKVLLGEYRPFSYDEVIYLTTTGKPEGRY